MTRRWIEFCFLYLVVPAFLALLPWLSAQTGRNLKVHIIPTLIVMALATLFVLRRDKNFDFDELGCGRVRTVPRKAWGIMLARFACGAAILTVALFRINPDEILYFPKRNPKFWLIVMCCYPLFSVLAQGVIYRALYWSRYSRLFPKKYKVVAGAAVFAFAHLPYANVYALAFPFFGGLMFLSTYRRTRSLMFASIEHALYGDFLFTIGWGSFFFHKGMMAGGAGG